MSRQRRRITEVECDGCGAKTLTQREALAGGWEPVVRCTACPLAYTGDQLTLLSARIYQAQLDALSAKMDAVGVKFAMPNEHEIARLNRLFLAY